MASLNQSVRGSPVAGGVHEASDPELGLTNIGDVPAQDWAADTGETKNPEVDKEPDDRHPAPGSAE